MINSNKEQKQGRSPVKVFVVCLAIVISIFLMPNIFRGLAKLRMRLHHRDNNLSGIGKAMLLYANDYASEQPHLVGGNNTSAGDASKLKQIEVNSRMPGTDTELKYWLKNMAWFHQFTDEEISKATGLSIKEVANSKHRFNILSDNRPQLTTDDKLFILPYPGGRHPRIGFLDGAINPQRETKFSVFTPWDANDYAVIDLPEAIWSNLGLTYLAHTHVDTIWTSQKIELEKLEWNRNPNGSLDYERMLPNKIAFGAKVTPKEKAVLMKLWLKNGMSERLSDIRVQICVMPKMAKGFEQQTNDNKVFKKPYVACRSDDGERWMIVAWTNCYRTWANPDCPCFHSDPQFPDVEPGQTQTIYGWFSFYQGENIEAELERIDSTGWQKTAQLDDNKEISVSEK